MSIRKELEALLKKYPDPRRGSMGISDFLARQEADTGRPRYGKVVDNKDPECLGRVRVASDLIAPGAVTPWIPMIALGATKDTGWWQLPDIGTQVIMGFLGKGHSNPVVLGCLYDLKNRPPEHSTEKRAQSILYQTKAHRAEFVDEGGKESLIVSTAEGKMRFTLTNGKGIELINELGDIKIECRKLNIEGKDGVQIEGNSKVSLKSGDKLGIKASGNTKLKSDRDVKLKGNNIKLNGGQGVTAGGRQIAAQGDKVMGFDVHNMIVPAGPGTAVVPLPHPFIGKLSDKLSDNVKINDHNAATEGSVATHDDPVHSQLPGTINFQQNPNREGEVTGGTVRSVKINGNEAAVIGSMVTTCNDVGMRNHSTVLAVGASIPMPVIINPKNMSEYNREREEQQKREPEFTNVRWDKGNCKEGEKAELSAQVKDIDDGNTVVFQVWREGQDPASHIGLWKLSGKVEGGIAKVEWSWNHPNDQELPAGDPKFFFTAHSAWCAYKRSDEVTIELKRPELSQAKWQDEEGNVTDKVLVGQAIKLEVSCNEDMEEGCGVMFRVYNKGDNPKHDRPVFETGAVNNGGKAEAEWTYRYRHDPENPLKEKPKFYFTANSPRCKEIESSEVEIGMKVDILVCNDDGERIAKLGYTLIGSDGTEENGTTDGDGMIISDTILPANYRLALDWIGYVPSEEKGEFVDLVTEGEERQIVEFQPGEEQYYFDLEPDKKYVLCRTRLGKGLSV